MSILQEYEEIKKDMGSTRYDAIGDYLNEVNKNGYIKVESNLDSDKDSYIYIMLLFVKNITV